MTFEEAMKAMREGKTITRERFPKFKYKIGLEFGEKCVVYARNGSGAILVGIELLADDWVVLNEKEDANGN